MSFQFHTSEGQKLTLESAVFQAIGAASVCWSNGGHGMFESERAREIGEKLIEFVVSATNERLATAFSERDIARSELARMTAERDAARRELDKVRAELRAVQAAKSNDWTSYI